MTDRHISELRDFYSLVATLAQMQCPVALAECSGRSSWLRRGVYFFMEAGENRLESGHGPRIVRVGTHALKRGSSTRLWTRLSQHRGNQKSGGGNHRASIFRLLVGTAIMARHNLDCPTWGAGIKAPRDIRAAEFSLECEVSKVIGAMSVLWLAVDDEPGAASRRGFIERNAVALLSNFEKAPCDAPSAAWLGHFCPRERVRKSGLWNQNHVDEPYDPAFLSCFETLIGEMGCTA